MGPPRDDSLLYAVIWFHQFSALIYQAKKLILLPSLSGPALYRRSPSGVKPGPTRAITAGHPGLLDHWGDNEFYELSSFYHVHSKMPQTCFSDTKLAARKP
ncbi:hypothetical protein RRG08_049419 [Elysia crispata]|uniref:Uncharacterized protein n=1 Tax=Elysia crispata TaxID=231223 RepID=A0AAE0ZSH3_9GAST|nr:hypothetical protein RRG08_049419 [Elysia crispata]